MSTDRSSYLLAEGLAKLDRLRAEIAEHEARCETLLQNWVEAHPSAVAKAKPGPLDASKTPAYYTMLEQKARHAFTLTGLLPG